LFREYEILDASNASMFRMSKNNDKVIISKDAEPGTYYIKVSSVINTPLDYIIDDSIFDHIQTIMIEWTVVEKPIEDEEDPDAVTDETGDPADDADGEETPPEAGEGDDQQIDGEMIAGGNSGEPETVDGEGNDSGDGNDPKPQNGNDGQENEGQNPDNNQQSTDGQGSEGQQSENNQEPADVQQQPNNVQTQLPENPVVTGTEEPSNEEEKTDPENNMVVEGNQEPAVEGTNEQPEPAQGEGE